MEVNPRPAGHRRRHQRRGHRARRRGPRAVACCWSRRTTSPAPRRRACSKLIHGGLRYLEHYEFRLVAEALAEREVLLRVAAAHHLAAALRHAARAASCGPRWMIRAGLFLYDHLARRSLPAGVAGACGSTARRYGAGLQAAAASTASSIPIAASTMRAWSSPTRSTRARRGAAHPDAHRVPVGARARRRHGWRAAFERRRSSRARARSSTPPARGSSEVLNARLRAASARRGAPGQGQPHRRAAACYDGRARLHPAERRQPRRLHDPVRGALHADRHDRRARRGDDAEPAIERRRDRLPAAARSNRYLAQPLAPADIVWTLRGVRPLYDDGTSDPSAVTRDYTLRVDDDARARRRCCRCSAARSRPTAGSPSTRWTSSQPYFPAMKPAWTARAPLPGGDFAGARDGEARDACFARYPQMPAPTAAGVFRRHGTRGARGARRRRATRRGLRRRPDRARARLLRRRTEWARDRRGRAVAAHQVRPAHDARRSASASRRCVGRHEAARRCSMRARIRGVLTDIDDTLTTDGKLTAEAYAALERLQRGGHARGAGHRAAGRLVRPHRAHVAGRRRGRRERRVLFPLSTHAAQARAALRGSDDASARDKRARLARDRRARSSRAVPGCALASDQPYRETDLAIDYCEDVPPLPLAAVERIVALMRAAGLTAKVSSIHVNGWFGDYDKLAMTRTPVRRAFRHRPRQAEPRAASSPATRRTMRRCSASSRTRSAWPTCGGSQVLLEAKPKYVTRSAVGRGLPRAGGSSSCSEIATRLIEAGLLLRTRGLTRPRHSGREPNPCAHCLSSPPSL